MPESRCIICGIKKNGLEIKDDYIINGIHWFKRNITKNERNYHLVVCRDCYKKYEKSKHSYDKRRVSYIALGIITAALWIFLSRLSLGGIIAGIFIITFMYLLSLLSYTPALKISTKDKQPIKKTKPKKH